MRWVALAALVMLNLAGNVFAAAIVETVAGDVKAGPSAKAVTPLAKGQRIEQGTTVVTGPKGLVILGFDDGQKIILNENSQFRVAGYSFNRDEPKKDLFSFALLKGALRSVTSLFTRRNANAYALRIPQATIGIRGTDFMVVTRSPAFLQLLTCCINVVNGGGAASFGSGFVTVPAANLVAAPIAASAVPPGVLAEFNFLQSLLAVTTAGPAGVEGAGLSGAEALGLGALGLGVAAGISGGSEDGPSGTTGTTGTTAP